MLKMLRYLGPEIWLFKSKYGKMSCKVIIKMKFQVVGSLPRPLFPFHFKGNWASRHQSLQIPPSLIHLQSPFSICISLLKFIFRVARKNSFMDKDVSDRPFIQIMKGKEWKGCNNGSCLKANFTILVQQLSKTGLGQLAIQF